MRNLEFLNAVFGKAMAGQRLSARDIDVVKQLVDETSAEESVLASGTIVMHGDESLASIAYRKLRSICVSGLFRGSNNATAFLALVIERIPSAEFESHPCYAAFAFEAVGSQFPGARINAARVLRRLARAGNANAIEALRRLVDDPDMAVRSAAKTALQLAGVE